nr:zinc finger, CCHC-type [Tanacetum cinerariifolium]
MEIVRDQSGNTLKVSQSRVYSGKLVQTLLEGHSILSLEGSLLGDCDVEKNDGFDRGLQTDVQDLLTTEAAYMTLMEAEKEAIWLNERSADSGAKLKCVAVVAT